MLSAGLAPSADARPRHRLPFPRALQHRWRGGTGHLPSDGRRGHGRGALAPRRILPACDRQAGIAECPSAGCRAVGRAAGRRARQLSLIRRSDLRRERSRIGVGPELDWLVGTPSQSVRRRRADMEPVSGRHPAVQPQRNGAAAGVGRAQGHLRAHLLAADRHPTDAQLQGRAHQGALRPWNCPMQCAHVCAVVRRGLDHRPHQAAVSGRRQLEPAGTVRGHDAADPGAELAAAAALAVWPARSMGAACVAAVGCRSHRLAAQLVDALPRQQRSAARGAGGRLQPVDRPAVAAARRARVPAHRRSGGYGGAHRGALPSAHGDVRRQLRVDDTQHPDHVRVPARPLPQHLAPGRALRIAARPAHQAAHRHQ